MGGRSGGVGGGDGLEHHEDAPLERGVARVGHVVGYAPECVERVRVEGESGAGDLFLLYLNKFV